MKMLFVYGTLKSDGSAHNQLKGATSLGEAKTTRGYKLTSLERPGKEALPGIRESATGSSVPGELYALTPEHLDRVDQYEDKDYERRKVQLSNGKEAWAYMLP